MPDGPAKLMPNFQWCATLKTKASCGNPSTADGRKSECKMSRRLKWMMLRKPLNKRLPSTQNHKTPNQHRVLPNSQTSIDRTEKGYLADSTPVAPGFSCYQTVWSAKCQTECASTLSSTGLCQCALKYADNLPFWRKLTCRRDVVILDMQSRKQIGWFTRRLHINPHYHKRGLDIRRVSIYLSSHAQRSQSEQSSETEVAP